MIRVRVGSNKPAGPLVLPIREGDRLPGFNAQGGAAGWLDGRWLVALGRDAEAAGALAAARLSGERQATLDLRALPPDLGVAFVTGTVLRAWRYDRLKSVKEVPPLSRLHVLTERPHAFKRMWRRAEAVLEGVHLARDLVAEPSNTLTPSGFVERLRPLGKAGVGITVLRGEALRRAGLGGLCAVGGGSVHPPCMLVLRWAGETEGAPVVFVGKGITFDTGGVCIKPAAGMEAMGADMAGAAACAGAMLALALRRSPAPAAAVIPLAENAIGGASYRPADILRLADGTSVEVVDSDAEGRLVLADALVWAARWLKPAAMIDLATLTYSIVAALGQQMAGLFDNDPVLAAHVAAAGQAVGEPVWRMPIGQSHRDDLCSEIADLRHCLPGQQQPDACHAAAFLREFTAGVAWAHLDIAGMEARTEASDRYAAGPTGFGVRLLDRLVAQRFEDVHR